MSTYWTKQCCDQKFYEELNFNNDAGREKTLNIFSAYHQKLNFNLQLFKLTGITLLKDCI